MDEKEISVITGKVLAKLRQRGRGLFEPLNSSQSESLEKCFFSPDLNEVV